MQCFVLACHTRTFACWCCFDPIIIAKVDKSVSQLPVLSHLERRTLLSPLWWSRSRLGVVCIDLLQWRVGRQRCTAGRIGKEWERALEKRACKRNAQRKRKRVYENRAKIKNIFATASNDGARCIEKQHCKNFFFEIMKILWKTETYVATVDLLIERTAACAVRRKPEIILWTLQ